MLAKMFRRAIVLIAFFASLLAVAGGPAFAQFQLPPSVDEVFQLSANQGSDGSLRLNWTIASGTYMYRDKFLLTDSAGQPVPFSTPAGIWKDDPTFGRVEIYHDRAFMDIANQDIANQGVSGAQELKVTYQGCSDAGICYPPETRTLDLKSMTFSKGQVGLPGFGTSSSSSNSSPTSSSSNSVAKPGSPGFTTDSFKVWRPGTKADAPVEPQAGTPATGGAANADAGSPEAALTGGFGLMLLSFLGLGVLLAFTPCIFPMIPILSGVLANSGKPISAGRGFSLSLAYVVAMAAAYGVVGMAAAWSGQNLQILLQNPITLGAMALVFVALALSMFGLYDLELPPVIANRLNGAANGKGGSIGGAMTMGFVAALIVGPCMTPPLAAALLYVAQSGDMTRGASALFALGFGMGLPLIAFGTFGARLLPRPGPWLVLIKQFFGFIFIGLAIWMVGRVLAPDVTMMMWGGLALLLGVWLITILHGRDPNCRWCIVFPVAGGATGLLGLMMLAGPVLGPGYVPPLLSGQTLVAEGATGTQTAYVQTVTTASAYDAALIKAKAKGQPILVDFTASWCVTCAEIERNVMNNPRIKPRLANISVIKADLSSFTSQSQALMDRFQVVGPPTLFFVDPSTGRELAGTRSIGELTAGTFAKQLDEVGA